MNKTALTFFTILCLLSTPFLIGSRTSAKADPELSVHNIDTDLYYATIQEAIDADETVDGHTILVDAGTYQNDVTIDKEILLKGISKEVTVFNHSGITIVANNVAISGFTINDTTTAIKLEGSQNSIITDNIFTGYCYYGVRLTSSSNNRIFDNYVKGNYHGVLIEDESHCNNISGNVIAESIVVGIWAWESSGNILVENTIVDNVEGVILYSSNDTRIIHNNFINNTIQASIYIGSYNNTWDSNYPSGGNYWSDYAGVDLHSGPHQNETGSDGIGDTSYVIDEDNQDNYPLMGMFSSFDFLLQETTCDVSVISNSTVSSCIIHSHGIIVYPPEEGLYGNPENSVSFKVTGPNGTLGFCRVMIPTTLLNGTFTIYIDGVNTTYTLLQCFNSTHNYLYFTYNHSTQHTLSNRADLNHDGVVNILDANIMSEAFFSKPGDPNWISQADLNCDDIIIILDLTLLISVYGETIDIAEHEVTIIPEFPSFLILPLFMIATLLAAIIYRRKRTS